MSKQFRELLQKVGSGEHTHKDLTRSEAATAMRMMLQEEATPAQIGAFLIAHRIKRPTAMELAGMLDAYDELGPQLEPLPDPEKEVVVLGVPYDGRSRTAPISQITALLLAVSGLRVIMHGGNRMATKYGIPAFEIWKSLGLDFDELALAELHSLLVKTGLAFIYIPKNFPQTEPLVAYRDQIGKRPPLATLELIWSPYKHKVHQIAGYVHPPTEATIKETFKLRGEKKYTLVKGLEGSCDLRLSQTTIVAVSDPESSEGFDYLKATPREYGLHGKDVAIKSEAQLLTEIEQVVQGKESKLMQAAIWNGGFYLWHCGVCANISSGINKAKELLKSRSMEQKMEEIKSAIKGKSYK
ncbi:MAG: anthranilate phosphoribosyltransferase family protein [Hormoscilla sp. SP5CHS1]|nr:anthranilate phosphoribosyltransferase family protein [Hormoscilla sp. SP12CHS1]MBC6453723.1 anthranilate phosphoribosyltransferase family protein [Hormoscilla sp. SP5CHS1]